MGTYRTSRRSASSGPIIINNGGGLGGGLFRSTDGGNGCGCAVAIVFVIVILVILILVSGMFSSPDSGYNVQEVEIPASSYNREKLENTGWSNDCVVDEIGWISEDGSISGLERKLRNFYDLTGVQPYVYLVGYRSDLISDSDKEQFASDYYENEIGNDYTFAFFYFCERNPDDVGYMYYEGGSRALGVMDAEAVDIFWAMCDSEWYNFDQSTEDALANTFNRTAERIMTKTRTSADNMKIVLIIILVIVVAAVIIIIMNKRRKQEKERNEETRKILETPLE